MSTIQQSKISVWNKRVNLNFQIRGHGPALIYFHPAAGLGWDPFLEKLAQSYTIYAPEFPGTTLGDPYAIHQVDDLADAVLIHEEAIRSLKLHGAVAVGQSFGGMVAIELAAAFPGIFSKLIVLDPIGLWREDAPSPTGLGRRLRRSRQCCSRTRHVRPPRRCLRCRVNRRQWS